ncbi:hypothetical protein [Mesorhizobium sp. SARCC-RB16n]|uniref:hypothetical protein n=1 Tax=Mesorhizobium sp. SARCC-RB16n TaxID=2116687 RepID=UPI00122F4D87|nr:hypothetical protein [Mesorhizobium sp. SARCC-RB16n]
MKTKLLAAGFAASVLSACSSSAGPFDGKSQEELAAFILSGLEVGFERTDQKGFGLKVISSSTKPLVLDVVASSGQQSRTMFQVSVTHDGGCSFTYQVKDFTPQQDLGSIGSYTLKADLSGVSHATQTGDNKPTTFEGAKFQCVVGEKYYCQYRQPELDKGEWPRIGPLDDSRKTKGDAAENRLNDAIHYMKANFCKK